MTFSHVDTSGGLAALLARERPPQRIDNDDARAIASWASAERTASDLAAARAEPFLHGFLVRAEAAGRRAGFRICRRFLWPLTGLVAVVWIVLLVTG